VKAIIIKTSKGFEPAFWSAEFREYVIEPGLACSTRKQAKHELDVARRKSEEIAASEAEYQAQYAYACGYRD
jgi:hypothetical protein